ncbi:MAG: helix-turn-helix transcriptional regulator [Clostridia bacterium]|nr:helix-turn-helix transcriptional regulator [Clostridia bacterium]
MSNVRLLKNPGYVYDLLILFYIKFNMQGYVDESSPEQNEAELAEARKFCEDLLARFSDIPDDLYIFFHAIETGRTFITTQYYSKYSNGFLSSYDFKFLIAELGDQNRLIRRLINFYLYDLSEEEMDACMQSQATLFSHIKATQYSAEEKSRLYEFFVDPTPYIQCLIHELMAKEVQLAVYYQENYEKILAAHNQFSLGQLCEHLEGVRENVEGDRTVYVTYCLINRLHLYTRPFDDGFLFAMGVDYQKSILFSKKKRVTADLRELGSALSDESRVRILELLLERDEIMCKDLEKIFDFSGSTAYHHITILSKFKLLNMRYQGKSVMYRLNRQYFDDAIKALAKFSNGRRE